MGLVSSQVLFLPENATEEGEEVTVYRLDSESLLKLLSSFGMYIRFPSCLVWVYFHVVFYQTDHKPV